MSKKDLQEATAMLAAAPLAVENQTYSKPPEPVKPKGGWAAREKERQRLWAEKKKAKRHRESGKCEN